MFMRAGWPLECNLWELGGRRQTTGFTMDKVKLLSWETDQQEEQYSKGGISPLLVFVLRQQNTEIKRSMLDRRREKKKRLCFCVNWEVDQSKRNTE